MKKFLFMFFALTIATLPNVTAHAAEAATGPDQQNVATENIMTPEAPPTEPPTISAPDQTNPATPERIIKIGFVDMAKVASDSVPGKAAYAEVKAESAKYQKQIKSKEKQLKKQKASIEAQMPSLTPAQRSVKAKDFQKKLESFQKFLQKAEQDIRTKEAKLLQKLYESVVTSANDYGTANGYAAIVMKKELLFIDSTIKIQDITAEIITLLDKTPKTK
ncbi:MAG TPA: OmpH family outer membrane protein [Geobacteraceae bacterium]|nr:OmpH family outer membrane protein [Geobacteraceae bacterium]